MTTLRFLGTRGNIEESSPRHRYHSSLLMLKPRIMIDYGTIHRRPIGDIHPKYLLITHAHLDHYAWTEEEVETEAEVYLTRETIEYAKRRPATYRIVEPGDRFTLGRLNVEVYDVVHSLRCPAVGYRLTDGKGVTFAYNPDLVDIKEKDRILNGVDVYIGDGSCIQANLVRRRGDSFYGHARVTTQANWCRKRGIDRIIFTHLGKETIRREARFSERNPDLVFAHDGMEIHI